MKREHIEKCSPNSLDVLSAGCRISRGDIGANKDYDTYSGRTAQATETELGQRVGAIAQIPSGGASMAPLRRSVGSGGQSVLRRDSGRVTGEGC